MGSLSANFSEKIRIGHFEGTDLMEVLDQEFLWLLSIYKEYTDGPERDFLMHNERAKIQQSDKISDISKEAAELFYDWTDFKKTYFAQGKVLSAELLFGSVVLTKKSEALGKRVEFNPMFIKASLKKESDDNRGIHAAETKLEKSEPDRIIYLDLCNEWLRNNPGESKISKKGIRKINTDFFDKIKKKKTEYSLSTLRNWVNDYIYNVNAHYVT